MKIAVKRVGMPLEIIESNHIYRTDCAKEIIKDCDGVDFVRLNNDGTLSLAADDIGLVKELKTNFLLKTNNKHFPIQKMVGTIVFIRCKYVDIYKESIWDYELEDITNDDIEYINNIISDETQAKLRSEFIDYKKGTMILEDISDWFKWYNNIPPLKEEE